MISCLFCGSCPSPRRLGGSPAAACRCGRLQRRSVKSGFFVWEFREGGDPDGLGRGLVLKLLPGGELSWSLSGPTRVRTFVGMNGNPEKMATALVEAVTLADVLES